MLAHNIHETVLTMLQFMHLWEVRYDVWLRRLIKAFSVSIAIFFALLAPLGHVKFYRIPSAAWILSAGAVLCVYVNYIMCVCKFLCAYMHVCKSSRVYVSDHVCMRMIMRVCKSCMRACMSVTKKVILPTWGRTAKL